MTYDIFAWSKAIITTTPTRWLNLVQAAPLELLLLRPEPGEWSALECLQHLVDTERVSFPVRIKALLAGQPFASFNPHSSHQRETPTVALATEFANLRKETLTILEQVTEADLDKRALHAEYGMVSMREFLHHWAAHDLNHTVQAERALMQPFIAGCGPWDVNYVDHDVRRRPVR
jgi:uncharacterized damage-inducible protein DinB